VFADHVVGNLSVFFNEDQCKLIKALRSEIIGEKAKTGKAELSFLALKNAIVFKNADRNTWQCLNDGYSSKCADVFIFQSLDNKVSDSAKLYIIEFKKSVSIDSLKNALKQFKMGIHNARAQAAFLGFNIENIELCIAYRSEDSLYTTAGMRACNINPNIFKAWKTSEFELEIDSTKKKYLCKKQKLYEKTVDSQTVGYGQMIL